MADQIIEKFIIKNFTCFDEVEFSHFSKGINVFIGENGTGKTHVLKSLYALSLYGKYKLSDLSNVDSFRSYRLDQYIGVTANKDTLRDKSINGNLLMYSLENKDNETKVSLDIYEKGFSKLSHNGELMAFWRPTLYLTHQEMLSWQRGFINIYSRQENGFDQTYYDLAVALNGEKLKSPYLEEAEALAADIKEAIQADIRQENGRFYFTFHNEKQTFEATSVAQGINKLGQLMYLILNGSLTKDTVVFWDEPEANLNPRYISVVAKVLKTLAKAGCQLFIATHDYLLIHLLSLDAEYPEEGNPGIRFFSFYKTPHGTKIEEGDTLADLQHNVILDEYAALHEKELTLFQENLK